MNLFKTAAAAALVACAPVAAQAAVGGSLSYTAAGGVVDGQGVFAGFDTSLGTLAGTYISYTLSFGASGSLSAWEPGPIWSEVTATADLWSPTGSQFGDSTALAAIDFDYGDEPFVYVQQGKSITGGFYDTETWAYSNLDQVTINYGVSILRSDAPLWGDIFPQDVAASLTVTYSYDPFETGGGEDGGDGEGPGAVPEPASWALMIVGFGAIGMASRRRRALAAA